MALDNFSLNCFNCRGLREKKTRLNIFHWLKESHPGITLLQETHSVSSDEIEWQKNWEGKIIFSHGTSFSSGVALLIPKQLTSYFEIKDIITDQYGRLILVQCVIHSNPVILISVYFPTKDKPREQTEFLDYVKQLLYNYNGQNIIIGGDFNICLNLEMDKHGGSTERESTYVKNLKALMQETDLIDIWRVRNPQIRQYSRREMSKKGLVQSRIDFWLVSVALEYQIKSTSIKPGNSSDHSIIKLGIELLETQKRGKGYWKFNNSLLRDQNYVNTIRKKLICEGNTEITDPNAILQKQKDYYENLYKSKYIKSNNLSKIEHSFFNNTNIPKLCELDKAICENPLEKKDYTAALKKLANDKSPGSDGLTSNFYNFFGQILVIY